MHLGPTDPRPSLLNFGALFVLIYSHRFMSKHNTYIAILDPRLHTQPFLRATSAILYTTILTVVARTDLIDRYPGLLTHQRRLLGQAFENGLVEVGFCQALSIIATWKEPSDRTSYIKLGYAIRCVLGKLGAMKVELTRAIALGHARPWFPPSLIPLSVPFPDHLPHRLAYELGLNLPPVRPLPEDEHEARLQLVSA